MSRRNPLALHFKKLGASRAYREERGEFLCDGMKLLEDAVKSGAEITAVLAASPCPYPLSAGTREFLAERELINSVSPLKNAQDTLFACKIPLRQVLPDITGTSILLDGVQDPGNVGAIVRTANAFGIGSIFLTGDCADPYNPKSIRASMGAIFRQDIFHISLPELAALRDTGAMIIGAGLWEGYRDIRDIDLGNSIIAIGSEGNGLSEGVLGLCSERIGIPIAPHSESLNAAAAAAIIIWEARVRMRNAEFGIQNRRYE